MSHSFFGVRVKVASPAPAASSASLYATLPVSFTRTRPLNASHSPRWSSERLAGTSASGTRAVRRIVDPDTALAEPLGRVAGLIGEPAVVGEGGGDRREDERGGLQVGPGD